MAYFLGVISYVCNGLCRVKVKIFFTNGVVLLLMSCAEADKQSDVMYVLSPDNNIRVNLIHKEAGQLTYSVDYKGEALISNSVLGLQFGGKSDNNRYKLIDVKRSSADHVWEQVWGENQYIRDNHSELLIDMKQLNEPFQHLSIRLRVFDDGLAFRYELPFEKDVVVTEDLSEFNFLDNANAWVTPALEAFRYEYLYEKMPVNDVGKAHTPLTLESASGVHVSIHEAALTDFPSMYLESAGSNSLRARLVPRAEGAAAQFKDTGEQLITSPWRTIQLAPNAAVLVESTLQLNLNENNKLKDTSWIKPGKYAGVWWEMHRSVKTWASGPAHGATTENTKRHIDFAAKYGFKGVLVEGWNVGWDGNWTKNRWQFSYDKAYPDFDLEHVVEYARKRDVGLVLQTETAGGVANFEKNYEAAFKKYRDLGILGIKTGYVAEAQDVDILDADGSIKKEWHHGQPMVKHFRRVLEEAAKNKLMVIAHEPIKGTGIRRTFPNMMTREAARGQEYNAWSEGNPPEHTTILPFTRMLSGPMDFTPGIFDLLFESSRPETWATSSIFEVIAIDETESNESIVKEDQNAAEAILTPDTRIHTTLAKQLALYVVIYSPLQMVPDFPENYEGHPMFQFVVDVPVDWAKTQGINGVIGEYFTVARKDRHSEDWYLGSVTDENPRELSISLDFLDKGAKYLAEIYRDTDVTHWKSNPLPYQIERREVTSSDSLNLKLAAGGGQAIRFKQL